MVVYVDPKYGKCLVAWYVSATMTMHAGGSDEAPARSVHPPDSLLLSCALIMWPGLVLKSLISLYNGPQPRSS
jgi:hypothetical protein